MVSHLKIAIHGDMQGFLSSPHATYEELKMQPKSNLVMPTVRFILGLIAILLSLIFSIEFVSQGNSGAAVISAILFCLITEFCKVAFVTDLAYYYETKQADKALFAACLVLLLFVLSISAAVYSLTINPTRQQAVIEQADGKIDNLKQAVAAKEVQLANCNPAYVSKCINPRTDELKALQDDLTVLMAQNDNLVEAKASAAFWAKAAAYMKTDANDLQLNFAIARAILLDLLGLILVGQYTAAKRMQNAPEAVYSDDKAAEVFALMSAKIEQLESVLKDRELEKKL